MPDGKHSVDCYMACLDMCYNELSTKVAANGGNGNLVEDNDFFVNHCTSTYLCKRAFKRVCENAYPKSDEKVKSIFGCTDPAGGMTIKLKEQQTLYETKVCLRLRHGDHRLDGPRSALPSWLIMEAGPGAKRNLRCRLREILKIVWEMP